MKKRKQLISMLCIACFITNLSQMPYFINSSVNRLLSNAVWIILAVVTICLDGKYRLPRERNVLLWAAAFGGLFVILLAVNPAYGASALPQPFFLSIFIFIIGSMIGSKLSSEDWDKVFRAYIYSGLIVTVNIYFTYIRGNQLTRFYLYSSKNSVSQIILTVWILILMKELFTGKWFKRAVCGGIVLFVTYVLLMLQSRATIIGMPIIAFWVLLNKKSEKRLKKIFLMAIPTVIVALLLNERFYDFLINQVLAAGRDIHNINELSSVRAIEWAEFWPNMKDTILFGHGRDKQESIILTALLEFGVVGGGILLTVAVTPFFWAVKNKAWLSDKYTIFSGIALVYCVNGIFEQLAPFGPGVKCYMLWLLFGGLSELVWRKKREAHRVRVLEG